MTVTVERPDGDSATKTLPDELLWAGIIGFENQQTGDGRKITEGALQWASLPMPFRLVTKDVGAHDGAEVSGRIQFIYRMSPLEDGSIPIWGAGDFDKGSEVGKEAWRLMDGGYVCGVSMDMDDVEFVVEGAEEFAEGDDATEGDRGVMNTVKARIRAATQLAIPAFEGAVVSTITREELDAQIAEFESEFALDDDEQEMLALIASGAPGLHKDGTPPQCKYCELPAAKYILHAEGMAYIPVCEECLEKGKKDASKATPDGSVDPSNIDRIGDYSGGWGTASAEPLEEPVEGEGEAEVHVTEMSAATETFGYNAEQWRVPRGNGKLSGRWIDMPDKILNALADWYEANPGRSQNDPKVTGRTEGAKLRDAADRIADNRGEPGSDEFRANLEDADEALTEALSHGKAFDGAKEQIQTALGKLQIFDMLDLEDSDNGPGDDLDAKIKQVVGLEPEEVSWDSGENAPLVDFLGDGREEIVVPEGVKADAPPEDFLTEDEEPVDPASSEPAPDLLGDDEATEPPQDFLSDDPLPEGWEQDVEFDDLIHGPDGINLQRDGADGWIAVDSNDVNGAGEQALVGEGATPNEAIASLSGEAPADTSYEYTDDDVNALAEELGVPPEDVKTAYDAIKAGDPEVDSTLGKDALYYFEEEGLSRDEAARKALTQAREPGAAETVAEGDEAPEIPSITPRPTAHAPVIDWTDEELTAYLDAIPEGEERTELDKQVQSVADSRGLGAEEPSEEDAGASEGALPKGTYSGEGDMVNGPIDDVEAANKYLHENDMTEFLPDTLKDKVEKIEWSVTDDGKLKIDLDLKEDLTSEEAKDLSSWISGQNSDGIGEGFEQQPFAEFQDEGYIEDYEGEDGEIEQEEVEGDFYMVSMPWHVTVTPDGKISFEKDPSQKQGSSYSVEKRTQSTFNWVEDTGGLPAYIRNIANALGRKGMQESRAIATAVNTVKRWARGGGKVTEKTRAKAAAALAEWEAKKAAANATAAITEIMASGAPIAPPKDWFENPHLKEPTALTVTEDGRVYGHLASWDVCHLASPMGANVCVTAPRSYRGYQDFHTGTVLCAEGTLIPTGRITMGTGHAPTGMSAIQSAYHYDNTGAAVADVRAGEDKHGIWVAGALRPGVSEERVRALRGSPLSGDWRRIGGALELVASLAVNMPGFPIPRPQGLVASAAPGASPLDEQKDELMSLVAAGMIAPVKVIPPGDPAAFSNDELKYLKQLAAREQAHAEQLRVEKVAAQAEAIAKAAAEQREAENRDRVAAFAAAMNANTERAGE